MYICDVLNMRQLLPLHNCWKEGIASLLITLLQTHSEAEHEVVVLKALEDAPGLGEYYAKIGFSAAEAGFEDAGLQGCYMGGEMVRT